MGNRSTYTRNIFRQLGMSQGVFDRIVDDHMSGEMNLGSWVGPKEAVSAESLSGLETENFEREFCARAKLVSSLMSELAGAERSSRWGFKILGDLIHASQYAAAWPSATIILLVRDPRDHALSVMKLNSQRADRGQQPFYTSYADVARGWLETVKCGRDKVMESGLRLHVLRYEDLVVNTDVEIRRLSDSLNVDLSDATNFYRNDFVQTHIKRFKHHGNLAKPINSASVGKWSAVMTDDDAEIFEMVAGDVMREYGYL